MASDHCKSYVKRLEKEIERLRARIAELGAHNSVREDYPLRCGDCGRAHILDCSLPSNIWNQIARPDEVLCPVCIDGRLQTAGVRCDEAEFHYGGTALNGKLYAESHGDVARLRSRVESLEADKARLVAVYQSAVQGRREFRQAFREMREENKRLHAREKALMSALNRLYVAVNNFVKGGSYVHPTLMDVVNDTHGFIKDQNNE